MRSAELTQKGGHVPADAFFRGKAVGDAVELVADVLDGVAGREDAGEVAGVGTPESQPDSDLVPRAEVSSICGPVRAAATFLTGDPCLTARVFVGLGRV